MYLQKRGDHTIIVLDSSGVDKRKPEDHGKHSDHSSSANNSRSSHGFSEFVQVQGWSTLVDNRHGEDSGNTEEEDW